MGTPIRVGVLAKSPILHEGLVRVLREEPALSISSARFDYEGLFSSLNSSPLDVVLLHIVERLEPSSWRHIAVLTMQSKVLALLRYPDPDLVKRAQQLGVTGIVTENVNHEVIVKAIQEVAAGRVWIDSPPAAEPSRSGSLAPSRRECEVLCLIRCGLSNREIADRLYISERTVKSHVNRLLQKFQVKNRVQLALCSDNSTKEATRA